MLIAQQFTEVARILPVNEKSVVSRLAPTFLYRSQIVQDSAGLRQLAVTEIKAKLPMLSVSELGLLVIYLLGHALARSTGPSPEWGTMGDKLKELGDEASDIATAKALEFQEVQQANSRHFTMMINVMKADYQRLQAAIGALRA